MFRSGLSKVGLPFLLVPTQQIVAKFLGTFREFPPRQKAASFTVDQVMETLKRGLHS